MQKPKQRKLASRVFTSAGWVLGTFHVPEKVPFMEFLNGTQDFFTLTEVKLPRQGRPMPFLALQRSAAALIVPGKDEWNRDARNIENCRRVSCLFDGGLVLGTLELPEETRVSDHLMRKQHFIVLRNCTVGLDLGDVPSMEANPIVIANTDRVIGVAEMESESE
ncbi:MAG: hypothetical protein AAF355_05630 [Myxococcota bacterium]